MAVALRVKVALLKGGFVPTLAHPPFSEILVRLLIKVEVLFEYENTTSTQ